MNNIKIKYITYTRKSSEQDDRQVLSLQSQTDELKELAKRLKLNSIQTNSEAKSAKEPGRIEFNCMLDDIEAGKAQGIIAWSADRLSRNSVDTGRLIYLMDKDVLQEIVTPSYTYRNTPQDKFSFSIGGSAAKLENDNKGVNVKRGMKTKAELGWYPCPAPTGYQNTPLLKKGVKLIRRDVRNFPLVRKCFEEILKGTQPIEVWRLAHDVLRLKTPMGKIIGRSTFYNMLTNPFYYGEYEWPKKNGKWYKGKHRPLITQEEFDTVQKIMGNKGRPVRRTHHYWFTGLGRCGECGYGITGSTKIKHYKTTNRTATYTFCHCTKKSKDIKCDQEPVNIKNFEAQIVEILGKLTPPQGFVDWAKKWLHVIHEKETNHQELALEIQHSDIEHNENRLNKLLDLYIDGKLDEDVYNQKKRELEKNKKRAEEIASDIKHRSNNHRTQIESSLDLANRAKQVFVDGTDEEKRLIISLIGTNFILQDRKIRINLHKHFEVFINQSKWHEQQSDWNEPREYADVLLKNPDLRPANPVWLPRLDSNQGHPRYKNPSVTKRPGLSHPRKTGSGI